MTLCATSKLYAVPPNAGTSRSSAPGLPLSNSLTSMTFQPLPSIAGRGVHSSMRSTETVVVPSLSSRTLNRAGRWLHWREETAGLVAPSACAKILTLSRTRLNARYEMATLNAVTPALPRVIPRAHQSVLVATPSLPSRRRRAALKPSEHLPFHAPQAE